MKASDLRVSAVQMDCQPGQVSENLRRAVPCVQQAAERGAQIVLLPELMPNGYCLTEALWDSAEPLEGPIVSWLTALARRLGLYLGTTFLEVDGEDFYNTFVLAAPDGQLAVRVRKSPPASLEAFVYRAGDKEINNICVRAWPRHERQRLSRRVAHVGLRPHGAGQAHAAFRWDGRAVLAGLSGRLRADLAMTRK